MKNELFTALLSDMSSFNFGVFSIALSIFTVLYAFILSRKDSLRDLNDIIKGGNNNLFLVQRVSFFASHTLRWKKINNNVAAIVFLSFCLYSSNVVLKYFPVTQTAVYLVKIMLILTLILAAYIVTMIFLVFKNYLKETSIN